MTSRSEVRTQVVRLGVRMCLSWQVQTVGVSVYVSWLKWPEYKFKFGELVDVGLVHDEEPYVEKFRVVEKKIFEKQLELENI